MLRAQIMSPKDSDTHDHGPPSDPSNVDGDSKSLPTLDKLEDGAKDALRKHTGFPRLAVWTTTLSNESVNAFSGAMAGVASGIVTCPLDVIKTKLQAQGSFRNPGLRQSGPPASALYHGLVGTGRTIVVQDGFKGLYRGLGPMLLGYLPTWAVYMAVYDSSKTAFANSHAPGIDEFPNLARVYGSITAGACSTLATNPIWVIKTRLMSQVSRSASDGARTPWQYNNTWDAAKKMYRAEGMRAFYSGLSPALLGLTHVAIQFPLYEYFKERFTGVAMGEVPQSTDTATTAQAYTQNSFGILAATFVSKVCATTLTYPHEVLRTRLQTQQRHIHPEAHDGVSGSRHSQSMDPRRIGNTDGIGYKPRYRGIIHGCKVIFREEGLRAFYNGMGTNMLRAVPAAMTTMFTFEHVKGFIGKLQEEGQEYLKGETDG